MISSECLYSGSYFSPDLGYFLKCLSKLFVIFMSSVWNISFVTFKSVLTPVSISGLLCVIYARRCHVALKSSKFGFLDIIEFCCVVMLFQDESICNFC